MKNALISFLFTFSIVTLALSQTVYDVGDHPKVNINPNLTQTPTYMPDPLTRPVSQVNVPTAVPQFTQIPAATPNATIVSNASYQLTMVAQLNLGLTPFPTPYVNISNFTPQFTQIPMATPNATVVANAANQLLALTPFPTQSVNVANQFTQIPQATPNATILANASYQLTQVAQNNLMLTPFPTQIERNIVMDAGAQAVTTASDGNGGNALEVAIAAHTYQYDSGNSTTVQLSAGATFTGTYTSVINQPAFSIQVTSDQNGTLIINQYIDSLGTYLSSAATFSVTANQGWSQARTVNGNYVRIKFINNGASTTTTLNINTYHGDITPTTQLNNQPMAINEVNGTALSLGRKRADR